MADKYVIYTFHSTTKIDDGSIVITKENIPVIDDDGFIHVSKPADGGGFNLISKTKELRTEFDDLENRGIFNQSITQIINTKVYRFFYNQAKNLVQLDPELKLHPDYAYYGIILPDVQNRVYVTGVEDGGTVISNLIDMRQKVDIDTNLEYSIADPGPTIVNPLTPGQQYLVEFYNQDKDCVARIPFVCEAAVAASLTMLPDHAVTDIFATFDNPIHGTSDEAIVYQYSDPTDFRLNVYLRYADGSVRNINHNKEIIGDETAPRLTIDGLDAIVTDTITDPANPFELTVTFALVQDSIQAYEGVQPEDGAEILYDVLSIKRTIKVHVRENEFPALRKIIPVFWYGSGVVNHKVFGIDVNGDAYNVESYSIYVPDPETDIAHANYTLNNTTIYTVNVNRISGIDNPEVFTIRTKRIANNLFASNGNGTLGSLPDTPSLGFGLENGQPGTYQPQSGLEGADGIMKLDSYTTSGVLKADNSYNGVEPNRFVVKTLSGEPITVAEGIDIGSFLNFQYSDPTTEPFADTTPLIIEYLNVQPVYDGQGAIVRYNTVVLNVRPLWISSGTVV